MSKKRPICLADGADAALFGVSAIKTVYDMMDYLASGMAAITERKRELTASDDLKIAATSASRTTATTPSDIFSRKRVATARFYVPWIFGFAR